MTFWRCTSRDLLVWRFFLTCVALDWTHLGRVSERTICNRQFLAVRVAFIVSVVIDDPSRSVALCENFGSLISSNLSSTRVQEAPSKGAPERAPSGLDTLISAPVPTQEHLPQTTGQFVTAVGWAPQRANHEL